MKDGLEAIYKTRSTGDQDVIPWLIAHSADTINIFHAQRDGNTAYQRIQGNSGY